MTEQKIIQGDCLVEMMKMADGCIDLTVTSPPYDNLRDYKGYTFDFEGIARQLYRVTKEGGVVVWIMADETLGGNESGTSFKQSLFFKECGFNLHDTMIWNKGTSPFQHNNRYISCFEYMFVFSKGAPKTTNLIKDRKNKYGGSNITGTERQMDGSTKQRSGVQKNKKVKEYGARLNIWEVVPVKANRTNHPAVFPEALARDHILSWSNEGDIVLDPFLGSGTTAKMAHNLKRNYIGIDISEEYCEIARKRIAGQSSPLL